MEQMLEKKSSFVCVKNVTISAFSTLVFLFWLNYIITINDIILIFVLLSKMCRENWDRDVQMKVKTQTSVDVHLYCF